MPTTISSPFICVQYAQIGGTAVGRVVLVSKETALIVSNANTVWMPVANGYVYNTSKSPDQILAAGYATALADIQAQNDITYS